MEFDKQTSASANGYTFLSVDLESEDFFEVYSEDAKVDIVCIRNADESTLDRITSTLVSYSVYKDQNYSENTDISAILYKNSALAAIKSDSVTFDKNENGTGDSTCLYTLLKGEYGYITVFNAELLKGRKYEYDLSALTNRMMCYLSYFPVILSCDSPLPEPTCNAFKKAYNFNMVSDCLYTSSVSEFNVSDSLYYSFMPSDTPLSLDISKKMIALTYDDGPSLGDYSETIMDMAEKYSSKVTFFTLGVRAKNEKEKLIRAHSLGCEIANHTYNHESFGKKDIEAINESLKLCSDTVYSAVGIRPFLVRPPGGVYRNDDGKICDIGHPIILWSIDTKDFEEGKTPVDVSETVKTKAFDGAIVLMHDIHEPSVLAADNLFSYLKENGFQLVTVSEIIEFSDTDLVPGFVYTSANKVYKK